MSSISNITASCRGLVDQMNRTTQGWHDPIQRSYYERRLNPLLGSAVDYQNTVYSYIQLLGDYERQIAALTGMSPLGTGVGEQELFRQQIDPNVLEQMMHKQR